MPFKEKFTIAIKYIPKPSKRRSGILANKIRFLVAHDTGNPGSTALDNVNWYINTKNVTPTASAHLFVDDKQILECVPALTAPPEKAWHVLYDRPKDNELYGVNANDAAIGVEYCYGGKINADAAYAKYIWVLAKLCYVFKLNPAKDITGHFFLDPGRKTDPVTGLAHSRRTYEQLLKDVVKEYNDCIGLTPAVAPVIVPASGTVKANTNFNLRNAPTKLGTLIEVIPVNTIIIITAKTDTGERVNNNSTWFKDTNEHWFWSGAVTLQDDEPDAPVVPPAPVPSSAPAATTLAPDTECFDFIKAREGYRDNAYQDSAGIWTIGYGTILYADHSHVKKGDVITQAQADKLLQDEVRQKSGTVNSATAGVKLNQHQYNALVSFTYNVGAAALLSSTLLKRVKLNPGDPTIREAFLMWDKARVDGELVVVQGLKNRRNAEADMYFL